MGSQTGDCSSWPPASQHGRAKGVEWGQWQQVTRWEVLDIALGEASVGWGQSRG